MAFSIHQIKHSGWTKLAPIGLAFLATFTGSLARALCLFVAILVSIWIFYDTELAKGSQSHNTELRKWRTGAAAVVLMLVVAIFFLGGNQIDHWAVRHKTEPTNHPSNAVLPTTSKQEPEVNSTDKVEVKRIPSAAPAKKHSQGNITQSPAPMISQKSLTQGEAVAIANTLIQKCREEHPGPVQFSQSDLIDCINERLEAQGMPFRINVRPKPAVLDNVNIQSFGSTQLRTNGTVIMKGGSVTGGQVGIENNGGQLYLDGTRVSDNQKNIVNNTEPKKKEPAEVKPPPQP
jgi:hypothetical protein